MKSLNKFKNILTNPNFDIEHETQMVQSRILSSILEIMDEKEYNQSDLERLTGLSQPFLSSIFNNKKKLSMRHIALIQEALGVILQPPTALSKEAHNNKFYNENDEPLETAKFIWVSENFKDKNPLKNRVYSSCAYSLVVNECQSSYKVSSKNTITGVIRKSTKQRIIEGKIIKSGKEIKTYG
ncbi:helix-turn-helix domain-containing protein [Winogradskyella sp. MH6]|uniref:helix-turn-helix domain-containing protein n=1 Tax=Winogradskyella sp. MH6 TaxID=2929510 RepID=UPI001FB1C7B0|nr:helix-turn-helix transcriptional regulator [Winogradskyella sp. MH6]